MKKLFFLLLIFSCLLPEPLLAQQSGFEFPHETIPVTNRPINNDSMVFRFAIMSDRTGGMIPGVFEKAAGKVNLMQPEFVMSVGDLIDGYTEDPKVWNEQWEEFEAIVEKLEMPFFYVPGNHDISNEKLLNVWKERRGSPWFHFIYKNVLFLALHTEDAEGKRDGGISDEQAAYIKKALKKNADVRWTLVFMHRPLWYYGNKAGYEKIEESLKTRKYTLFSAHHHHYLKAERNGANHYILATTGGGSHLRGAEFGEFEHITWVTMTDEGPQVAHVALDGIHDEKLVTEDNYDLVQALRLGRWFEFKPVIHDKEQIDKASTTLVLRNVSKEPMHVKGKLHLIPGLQFEPDSINLLVRAESTRELAITITSEPTISLHQINESGAKIELLASYDTRGNTISLPAAHPLVFDWLHKLSALNHPVIIDGSLSDWGSTVFTEVSHPIYIQEDWDWKGSEDGRFRFATAIDKNHLYIAFEAFDDHLIINPSNELSDRQDKLYIHLDDRTAGERVYPGEYIKIELAPENEHGISQYEVSGLHKEQLQASSKKTDQGFIAEVAIPLSSFAKSKGSIRLNIGWMDHDRPENTKPSVLWWRPVFGSSVDEPGFSTFSR